MGSIVWQDTIIYLSFLACIAGLVLVFAFRRTAPSELEQVDEGLFAMIFAFWIVYCATVIVVRLDWLESEWIVRSLRLTSALSYFLTWASVLSLPLHRIAAVREIE
ncbi:hypothetical protein GKIL_3460 [Gloeobacter kilaueensis JS1]|uniref:Uncharacterized protein n=2 Tax=Gloeobacter TaxID=33071 RepID=U5QL93_GLOK1|nr:hypothetical protein GKIL_3460 [Gloeobacter kilaueensis JS1]